MHFPNYFGRIFSFLHKLVFVTQFSSNLPSRLVRVPKGNALHFVKTCCMPTFNGQQFPLVESSTHFMHLKDP